MGKLGRNSIVILTDNDTSNWKIDLLRELKEIGYKVDLNKLFWFYSRKKKVKVVRPELIRVTK